MSNKKATYPSVKLVLAYAAAFIIVTSCGFSSAESKKSPHQQNVLQDKYKTDNPQPIAGVDLAYVTKLVEIVASNALDTKSKDSCVFYIWNAFSNPIEFDTKYKDFSTQCLRLLANGKLDKEEKPFLAEWSSCDTDLEYLRFVLDRVLTYCHCKSNGDDTDGIGAALHQIKQTRLIPLPKYEQQENAFQYLRRLNETVLRKHHKVALMQKDYPDIYVCDDGKVETLKGLARKVKLELVEP